MKGHEEVREAARASCATGGFDLDYHGFVEGDDIAKGTVDVVVTDGFTGNIALKTAEGTARFISTAELKAALTSSPLAKLGALLAMPALKQMRAPLDPGAVNGGPLLGLNGIVVKSHGGADATGLRQRHPRRRRSGAKRLSRPRSSGNLKRLTAVLRQPTAAPSRPWRPSQ